VHDYRLLLDLEDDGISRQLSVAGDREPEHRYILERKLHEGMTILDLGANIGYYSAMMGRRVGASGKVYAVEPSLANYSLLNLNMRLNGLERVVETYHMGFSNQVGVGRLYESEYSNCHTFHPVDLRGESTQRLKPGASVEVPVTTIGAFAAGRRRLDLIRMDIEGYEVEVLDGLVPDLDDGGITAMILFETHQPMYDGEHHDMSGVLWRMFERGYEVEWLVADHFRDGDAYGAYRERGYTDEHILAVFESCDRAIYRGVSRDHAIELICETELVRAALLTRHGASNAIQGARSS